MYKGATVAVVVPTYNEEGLVGEVIDTVPAFVDRIYVVDDCSTDGTWAEIRQRVARTDSDASLSTNSVNASGDSVNASTDGGSVETAPSGEGAPVLVSTDSDSRDEPAARSIVAIRHETNTGVGGAIKTGYRRALADGVDVTAVMAGDGQMDPAILDRIVDPVVSGVADYAKGNRLCHQTYRQEMSAWRTFGNFLLTYLTRIATGYWRTMDPQNGYTAVSNTALETIELESLYDEYGFCNDVLARLNTHGLRVADVPMPAVYGDETSHIRYSRFVPALSALLLRSYSRRLTHRYVLGGFDPLVAFHLFSVGSLGGGTLLALFALLSARPALAAWSALLFFLGVGSLLFGLAADRRRNAALEVRVDPDSPSLVPGADPDPSPSDSASKGGS